MGVAAGLFTQGIGSIGNGIAQANAAKAEAAYKAALSGVNEKTSQYQAKDAIDRGDAAVAKLAAGTERTVASQRVAAAANGLDPNSGSARDIQEDTKALSALDSITIKNNAMREAFGYKSQAIASSLAGQAATMAGNNAARNTLMTGGIRAIGYGLEGAGYAFGKDKG